MSHFNRFVLDEDRPWPSARDLDARIRAADPCPVAEFSGLVTFPATFGIDVVTLNSPLSSEERAAVQAVIDACCSSEAVFEKARRGRIGQVNLKTGLLISQGVVFKGVQVSLSLPAQINLIGLDRRREGLRLSYPVYVASLDDSMVVTIDDPTEASSLYREVEDRKFYLVNEGNRIKSLLLAATSQEELDAVVDDRA